MISHKLRLIFIHVPKCAGTSVIESIRLLDPGVEHGHVPWQAYENPDYADYFRFAIVRNPWDRALACYRYARSGQTFWHNNLAGHNVHPDFHYLNDRSFEWCVRDLHGRRDQLAKPAHLRPHYRYNWDHQWRYVFDDEGNCRVDELLRFEDLPECLGDIRHRFQVDTLLKENVTRRRADAAHEPYYSDTTVELVRQIYARDVELFDYEF